MAQCRAIHRVCQRVPSRLQLLTTESNHSDNDSGLFALQWTETATELDAIDRCLIALLQADGRLTHAAIARRLCIPEPTVRRRLKRLLDEQAMQIVAVPNPH